MNRTALRTVVLCSGLCLAPVLAQNEVEVFYAHYLDNQGLTVSSPVLGWLYGFDDNLSFKGRLNYETFAKSGDGANSLDAVSGATTVVGSTGSGF